MKLEYGQSKHYEKTAGEIYFAYQNRMGALTGSLNKWKFEPFIKDSHCILDFGCGGGWLLNELSAKQKLGVEPNTIARTNCSAIGIPAVETIDDIPGEMCFDTIISNHALEHVLYPIEALRQLKGHIRESGVLVLVVPIDDWRVQRDYTGKDIDHHLHTWTPRLLANTLVEAGYKVDRIEVITDAWPPGVAHLKALPAPIFRLISFCWSFIRRRRQLRAIASVAKTDAAKT